MDLHRIIPKIRPDACYVLNHAQTPHTIVIWHGPGEQPTQAELEAGWELCLPDEIQSRHDTVRSEVRAFIYSYYDEGTQNSFNAEFANLVDKQVSGETLTAQELQVKDAIKSVKTWIQAVMGYYYSVRQQIFDATAMAEVQAITWNFKDQYGENGTVLKDPCVKLSTFYGYAGV
jgi:hypothetical protein